MSPASNPLTRRSNMMRRVRNFFEERSIIEVDTLLLNDHGSLDTHIEAFKVVGEGHLIPSPEYNMKALLSQGSGDIYQFSHVFRKDERGQRHHTEFMMIEYYRVGMPYEAFIDEVVQLVKLFTGSTQVDWTDYPSSLELYAPQHEDENIAWGTLVEPHFQNLTVVDGYPSSDLAKRRFEVYFKGLELANGYEEKEDSPLLPFKIPSSCGVALGFDRLMMLKEEVSSLQDLYPFCTHR
jgi:lysyl-tRNA synthetase class 2